MLDFVIYSTTTIALWSVLGLSLNLQFGLTGLVNFGQVLPFAIGAYGAGRNTVAFYRKAFIRYDLKTINDSLSTGIQNGYLSQNDARKAIGLNPINDGDAYMVNTALAPVGERPPNVA